MKSTTKNRIRFSPPLELRFLAVPTRWTVREDRLSGQRCLVPEVSQHVERRAAPVTDPDYIRRQFLRMQIDEDSAIEFLNSVGLWSFVEGRELVAPAENVYVGGVPILGAFGHRWLDGRATIETVESLQIEQGHWRALLRSPAKLRGAFGPAPLAGSTPHDKAVFATESHYQNTLRIHLEWRRKHAHAVVQPVTGHDLLTALAWVDLLTGAPCRVCQNANCGIEYTRGGSKFCNVLCERATAMRETRRRKAAKEDEKST